MYPSWSNCISCKCAYDIEKLAFQFASMSIFEPGEECTFKVTFTFSKTSAQRAHENLRDRIMWGLLWAVYANTCEQYEVSMMSKLLIICSVYIHTCVCVCILLHISSILCNFLEND